MSREKDLKALSAGWKFAPPDKNAWIARQSARTGIPAAALEKAFEQEFSGRHELWEELEIPDQMRITYKFSYGGHSPFFRALRDYGRLLGARCEACDFTYCPPRRNCSRCYGETRWVELPGTGVVETFTTIYKGPLVQGKPKLICAYIRLDGSDFIVMSNVEMQDAARAEVGMKVRVVMHEERNGSFTDFHFVPASEGA